MCNDIVSYQLVGKRSCHGIMKGFRLNSRKISVQRLRTKFLYLFQKLGRTWRSSYGNFLCLLKKNIISNSRSSNKKNYDESYGNCRNLARQKADYAMYGGRSDYKLKAFSRSNSFYAEAIADCLDFIKRNSLSMEEKPVISGES